MFALNRLLPNKILRCQSVSFIPLFALLICLDRCLCFNGINSGLSPSPTFGQQQQQQVPPAHSGNVASAAAVFSANAIDRFDTNLNRFATGPSVGMRPNRVVLPMDLLQRLQQQVRNGVWQSNNRKGKGQPTNGGTQGSFVGTQPEVPIPQQQQKTRFLTNPAIFGGQQQQQQQQNANEKIGITDVGRNQGAKVPLDIQQPAVPALPDFRHEDIRPAVDGERLGPQGKFAGETNEYKEDLGRKFTRTEDTRTRVPLAEFGTNRMEVGNGPAAKFMNSGFNSPPLGAHVNVDREMEKSKLGQNAENVGTGESATDWRGRIRPYLNAPEEITGSRWRTIDEHFIALNGGNRGRGPNRYVRIDLLNE